MAGAYIQNGQLMHGGRYVHEIGLNCPDLLIYWLDQATTSNPAPFVPEAVFTAYMQRVAQDGVRFIRFAPFGHRPKTYRVAYRDNKSGFYTRMDALVAAAEVAGILLIPSLFFNITALPQNRSETVNQWGNPSSATITEMYAVVDDIVGRYKNSPAIGYWEFSNEIDQYAGKSSLSSPDTSVGYFSLATDMETVSSWTTNDLFTLSDIQTAVSLFKARVNAVDTGPAFSGQASRFVSSGHGGWRYFANTGVPADSQLGNDWLPFWKDRYASDTSDVLSLHPYPSGGWQTSNYTGLVGYLKRLVAYGKGYNKPVIIGEFGDLSSGPFRKALDACLASGAQLIMPWQAPMSPTVDDGALGAQYPYNIRWDRSRASDWSYMAALNRTLRNVL